MVRDQRVAHFQKPRPLHGEAGSSAIVRDSNVEELRGLPEPRRHKEQASAAIATDRGVRNLYRSAEVGAKRQSQASITTDGGPVDVERATAVLGKTALAGGGGVVRDRAVGDVQRHVAVLVDAAARDTPRVVADARVG